MMPVKKRKLVQDGIDEIWKDIQRNGFHVVEDLLSKSEDNKADLNLLEKECNEIISSENVPLHTRSSCIYEPARALRKLEFKELPDSVTKILSVLLPIMSRFKTVAPCVHQSDSLYLLHEQYICKSRQTTGRTAFPWHFDSENVEDDLYQPYVSVWICLDDVNEGNGTLQIIPFYDGQGIGDRKKAATALRDLLVNQEYEGFDTFLQVRGAQTITLKRGSAVILSDVVLHRSFDNKSSEPRRCYMPQIGFSPIKRGEEGHPFAVALPLEGNEV